MEIHRESQFQNLNVAADVRRRTGGKLRESASLRRRLPRSARVLKTPRESGKGHNEVIYKDALIVELSRAGIPFSREKKYEIACKGLILPHHYRADVVVWDKILFEAKAVEALTDPHVKQVLNYLAASKLRVRLLVNFGADSLEWKRVIL
jgi:GxxExxY protein